jgi:hypothetical protein
LRSRFGSQTGLKVTGRSGVFKERASRSYFQIANFVSHIISVLGEGVKKKVTAAGIPRLASKERNVMRLNIQRADANLGAQADTYIHDRITGDVSTVTSRFVLWLLAITSHQDVIHFTEMTRSFA